MTEGLTPRLRLEVTLTPLQAHLLADAWMLLVGIGADQVVVQTTQDREARETEQRIRKHLKEAAFTKDLDQLAASFQPLFDWTLENQGSGDKPEAR